MFTRSAKFVAPSLLALACGLTVGVVASPSTAAEPTTYINAGGPALTDSLGRTWAADTGFVGGASYSTTSAISGTTNPTLFKTERGGVTGYNVPVKVAGTYRVTLYFAELYWTGKGQRVFSVTGEGRSMVPSLDIFATVGKNAAMMVSTDIPVTDGSLTLRFAATKDRATLAGIAVAPVPVVIPTPSPTVSPRPTVSPSPTASPRPTVSPSPTPAPSVCTQTMAAGGNVGSFINALPAGATGCLPGGTYTGSNVEVTRSGTAASRITVQSVPGQTAQLKMRLAVNSGYLTFRGLNFDSDHQLGTSNVWVKSGGNNVTFENNRFADSGLTGTSLHDGQCLYSDAGSSNVRIVRNVFQSCGSLEHFHHGMYVNGTGYTITDNLVLGTKAFGIHLYPNLSNSLVANNTVDGSGRAGIIVAEASTGNRVVNNILTNNARGGVDGYANTGTNTVQDNLCWANATACVQAGMGFSGTGNVTADPLYLNRAAGDLRVAVGSPAVGTANAAYAAGPDLNGVTRPQGGAPDKGAYER